MGGRGVDRGANVVARARKAMDTAQRRHAKLVARYNKIVKKYGRNSAYAQNALAKVQSSSQHVRMLVNKWRQAIASGRG